MGTFIELTPYYGADTSTYYIEINAITSIINFENGSGSHVYTTSKDFVCLESAEYIFDKMKEAEEVING